MLSVTSAYSKAINADCRDMPYRVTLAGSDVFDRSRIPNMTLDESVGGGSCLSVGTSNSATLKLTLKDSPSVDYSGMLVEPESGLVLPDGSVEWLPLGKFWVTDYSTSNDGRTVHLTCADGMYHLTGDFESELTYPTTIKALVNEVVTKAGIGFEEPATWADIVVRRKPERATFRDVLGYAAGCCGCNARFNRDGNLEFVWYKDSGVTIKRNTQYLNGMTKLNKPLDVHFEVTGAKETYTVTVITDENGGVAATPGHSILEGDTVVLSVNPYYGYELATISAVTEAGSEVTLYVNAEKTGYTFIQPDSNVTVTASFRNANGGPYKLNVNSIGNGTITYAISENEAGVEYFAEGDEVMIFVTPNSGYEIDELVTIPSGIVFANGGTTADGGIVYTFPMPKSDVTINASFKVASTYYSITRSVNAEGFAIIPGYILIENATTGGSKYKEGDIINVDFSRAIGHEFDRYEANVKMVQTNSHEFRFTMPAYDVSIDGYFKEEADPTKEGAYSFLKHPSTALPPTSKPYWAVFYENDTSVSINGKYYLVWFDSWSVGSVVNVGGKTGQTFIMNGYYYCGSRNNNSRGSHFWDDGVWFGNGASSSSLSWGALTHRWHEGKCLIASNANIFKNGILVFQNCETSISKTQSDWLVNGVDVREKGALSAYPCPDTYSTPLPGANWLLLNHAYVYGADDELKLYENRNVNALFFDDVTVESVGQHFSNSEDTFFKLTFSNITAVQLLTDGSFSSYPRVIEEECYILIRDPDCSSAYGIALGGAVESTCGLIGANRTFREGGLFFYNNSSIICDCSSYASTFSLRTTMRSVARDSITLDVEGASVTTSEGTIFINSEALFASSDGNSIVLEIKAKVLDYDEVTISYTNPLIYEKMVPAISDVVQGIAYTPAKVKHRGNPALQAGDIVSVPDKNNVYHTVLIMQQTLNFGGGMNSEISCPGQTEKTSSFSANGPLTSQIKKEVAEANSALEHDMSLNSAQVYTAIYRSISATNLSVARIEVDVGKNESSIKSLVQWQGEASATLASVSEKADNNKASIESLTKWRDTTNESIAKIEQDVSSNKANIALVVDNGSVKGSVVISAINDESTLKISADRLDIYGKTLNIKVDATNITGKLIAEQINADGMVADDVQVSGYINAKRGNIGGLIISNSRIHTENDGLVFTDDGLVVATNLEVESHFATDIVRTKEIVGRTYGGTRLILDDTESPGGIVEKTGTLTARISNSYIITITASHQLQRAITVYVHATLADGGKVTISKTMNAGETTADAFSIGGEVLSVDGISPTSFTYYENESDNTGGIRCEGYFAPWLGDYLTLGTPQLKWGVIYATTSTINTSNRDEKNTISKISDVYGEVFDRLVPVTYKLNKNESDRLHLGLIAQDVKQSLDEVGLDSKDFAAYCEWEHEGVKSYGIRYEELVPLTIREVQKLKERVAKLEKIGE